VRPDARAELRAGAATVLPAVIAVVPFALLYGGLAAQKGMSVLEVVLTSALVFAGSAQMVAVDSWTHPAPWALVTVSTLLINARHLLMGASLAPHLARFRTRHALVAVFLMTDEAWALAEQRARARPLTAPFYFGVAATLWLAWVTWSGIGAALGQTIADPAAYGFDFAFAAIFITLLTGLPRTRATGASVAAGAAVATLIHELVAGPWYIAAGGLAGAIAGALVGGPSDHAGEPDPGDAAKGASP
jgi:4-azaleucine resistance transporter AzlC